MVTKRTTPAGYVKTGAAARRLECSDRKIRALFDRGRLQGMRSAGGFRLIAEESLERFQRYLSVTEAAHQYGVSPGQIRRRFDTGELEGYRTPSGARRISPDIAGGRGRSPEGDGTPM